MKTFAAALLLISAYGAQTEATTQVSTGATAEIEAAVESHGHGYGLYGGLRHYGHGLGHYGSSYSDSYSASDFFSSDYSGEGNSVMAVFWNLKTLHFITKLTI